MTRMVCILVLQISLGAACSQPSMDMNDMTTADAEMEMVRKTTIAEARLNQVTAPIRVTAVVTAVRGDDPKDIKEWYIEDPAGGPNSGIAVYCNKTATADACPMAITPPALHDLVTITGTLHSYMTKMEMYPTALVTVMTGAPEPPMQTVQAADLASNGRSDLRGVRVQVATKLTIDSVTPDKLYDTRCKGDGGVGHLCMGCRPPTYSGFQAQDGAAHEVLIENYFYTSEHLQSSPECLTQMGAVPVTAGKAFSLLKGILDFDPYAGVQVLSPVTDKDYMIIP